jgi:hypothetical protein
MLLVDAYSDSSTSELTSSGVRDTVLRFPPYIPIGNTSLSFGIGSTPQINPVYV